ncbi:hypothetical protein AQUCO_09300039v1 [Aquilegia coerulea]|uniref:Uncharacterized protein n=1 Tax=Aquilegia coerulea TaxID=218851 RepID=A0A2G5C583_AQUCA|nr:hypothetical protein AQUCO_09300039v1 [Aquilegia coerulea]
MEEQEAAAVSEKAEENSHRNEICIWLISSLVRSTGFLSDCYNDLSSLYGIHWASIWNWPDMLCSQQPFDVEEIHADKASEVRALLFSSWC